MILPTLKQKYVRIFFVALILLVLIPPVNITAETDTYSEIDTSVLFITELLSHSLPLIQQHLDDDSLENAKILSKINTEQFPVHLQNLRDSNSEISDEIHLLLLDIHGGIGSTDNLELVSDISKVENLLSQYNAVNPDYGKVIALILTIVDEQYQIAIIDENQALHQFSISLVKRSTELFSNTNYGDRLKLEINSFLVELEEKIQQQDDFLSVGTLITAINRDFIGHESVSYDKQKFYDNIRKLYSALNM